MEVRYSFESASKFVTHTSASKKGITSRLARLKEVDYAGYVFGYATGTTYEKLEELLLS